MACTTQRCAALSLGGWRRELQDIGANSADKFLETLRGKAFPVDVRRIECGYLGGARLRVCDYMTTPDLQRYGCLPTRPTRCV